MSTAFKPLTDNILYFPACREPLSSDIFLIEGKSGPVLFDVGGGSAALAAALSVREPVIVLSHFHKDHIGNMPMLSPKALYLSKETQKHVAAGTIVTEATEIDENITVLPLPSSHSKGSLALKVYDDLLIGDALYPRELNGQDYYNTGLLKEEIALIEALAPARLILSHRKRPVLATATALSFLRRIYRMRDPGETYIPACPAFLNEE